MDTEIPLYLPKYECTFMSRKPESMNVHKLLRPGTFKYYQTRVLCYSVLKVVYLSVFNVSLCCKQCFYFEIIIKKKQKKKTKREAQKDKIVPSGFNIPRVRSPSNKNFQLPPAWLRLTENQYSYKLYLASFVQLNLT